MSYLAPADFRIASLAEYCANLELTDDEASDPRLTAAIARLSQRVDDLTNDHFETEALTVELDGDGTPRLMLPKRCTAVTTVKTRDAAGTLTTQAAGTYRLHSSLDAAGAVRLGDLDFIDVIPGGTGLTGVGDGSVWPAGPRTVQVVGTFSWTTTPPDVKRAVALLVYDSFKPIADPTRRAERWATGDAAYSRSLSEPTGLPEADQIIADFTRQPLRVG